MHPEPVEASIAAEHVVQSLAELWRRAHEDVAPTISREHMRALLVLENEPDTPGAIAEGLGVDAASAARLFGRLEQRTLVRRVPSGAFCLTGAGRCVLEATRQRRRQLLEQVLVTAAPSDRPVLREAIDQLYGRLSPLARVPRSRTHTD
ncbi:MarR family transcriptional regulator [Streptomyces sp. NPDC007206]|uniref:MarR family winged helix-turn-helix transcriptional regulator n=1 Tax=Streptomyces sp. NPDC007206 TaxID=3154317 RepID=UPI003408014A